MQGFTAPPADVPVLLLIDTAGCGCDEQTEKDSDSKCNDGEARVCSPPDQHQKRTVHKLLCQVFRMQIWAVRLTGSTQVTGAMTPSRVPFVSKPFTMVQPEPVKQRQQHFAWAQSVAMTLGLYMSKASRGTC